MNSYSHICLTCSYYCLSKAVCTILQYWFRWQTESNKILYFFIRQLTKLASVISHCSTCKGTYRNKAMREHFIKWSNAHIHSIIFEDKRQGCCSHTLSRLAGDWTSAACFCRDKERPTEPSLWCRPAIQSHWYMYRSPRQLKPLSRCSLFHLFPVVPSSYWSLWGGGVWDLQTWESRLQRRTSFLSIISKTVTLNVFTIFQARGLFSFVCCSFNMCQYNYRLLTYIFW